MNTFNSAPLPFQGQKRNFIKQFRELIKDEFRPYKDGIFIDAFGGSGLLSHNIKQIYPNARVIYNDYDNYSERLAHIDETNEISQAIEPITTKYKKNEKLREDDKRAILEIIENFKKRGYFMDWVTISSFLFFSGNYTTIEEDFKKQKTFYIKSQFQKIQRKGIFNRGRDNA
jgi:hypothetical protein